MKGQSMKRFTPNVRPIYIISAATLLLVVLGTAFARQFVLPPTQMSAQHPQTQLAVPAAVGTLVVLPTLPPIAAVPSVGPNALTFAPWPTMAPTAVPTAIIANQQNPVRILA